MHPVAMNYAARGSAIVILSVLFVLLAVVCWWRFNRSSRPWMFLVLGGYNLLLLALFVLGVVRDDGYGWAFLPLFIATAPWSFLAPAVTQGAAGSWFASGILGNFVLFVVLCGGLNSLLLFALVRRVVYSSDIEIGPSLR